MNLKLERYSVPAGISKRVYAMIPDPEGAWVRFAEVEEYFADVLNAKEFPEGAPVPVFRAVPRVLCHKRIEFPASKGIGHTYCYLPTGHEGECRA